jgi:starch synthase
VKILFVASEGLPFSKTGGLADVVEALPKALVAMGHEVAVVLPRYRGTKAAAVIMPSLTVPMGERLRFPGVCDGTLVAGVRYYFVDDPEYFDRPQLYGEKGKDYPDNAERFAEFCRAAIEIAKHVYRPDVIHCHDWQSALVPILLRSQYAGDPMLNGLPVIFTIHNMGYLGLFPRSVLAQIGVPESLFHLKGLEFFGNVSFLKGGLIFSDYLTTVSRKYAQEIQTPEYGCGLDGVVRDRAANLRGILNGVDYSQWSPEKDPFIAAQYSAKNLAPKQLCKKDLLEQFKLPSENNSRPLVGIVSRFADQKGLDLIAEKAAALLKENLALVALGNGEPKYEQLFRELAGSFPKQVAVKIAYDNVIAHKIEAGADIFLMPSRYEPCGLNQIYSLRYGTVPVVRATGGLDDTIEQFDVAHGTGTGFKFGPYTGDALVSCLHQAVDMYSHAKIWQRIQLNGMSKDFSWKSSAGEYLKLYDLARKGRIGRATGTSNG